MGERGGGRSGWEGREWREEEMRGCGGKAEGKEVVLYACEQQRDGTGEVEVEQAGTRMYGVVHMCARPGGDAPSLLLWQSPVRCGTVCPCLRLVCLRRRKLTSRCVRSWRLRERKWQELRRSWCRAPAWKQLCR